MANHCAASQATRWASPLTCECGLPQCACVCCAGCTRCCLIYGNHLREGANACCAAGLADLEPASASTAAGLLGPSPHNRIPYNVAPSLSLMKIGCVNEESVCDHYPPEDWNGDKCPNAVKAFQSNPSCYPRVSTLQTIDCSAWDWWWFALEILSTMFTALGTSQGRVVAFLGYTTKPGLGSSAGRKALCLLHSFFAQPPFPSVGSGAACTLPQETAA